MAETAKREEAANVSAVAGEKVAARGASSSSTCGQALARPGAMAAFFLAHRIAAARRQLIARDEGKHGENIIGGDISKAAMVSVARLWRRPHRDKIMAWQWATRQHAGLERGVTGAAQADRQ